MAGEERVTKLKIDNVKKVYQTRNGEYRNFDFLLNSSALNEDNTSYFIKASVLNPPYASLLHLPGSG